MLVKTWIALSLVIAIRQTTDYGQMRRSLSLGNPLKLMTARRRALLRNQTPSLVLRGLPK